MPCELGKLRCGSARVLNNDSLRPDKAGLSGANVPPRS